MYEPAQGAVSSGPPGPARVDGTSVIHRDGAAPAIQGASSKREGRLGQDSQRNDSLLQTVRSLDRSWPVLVFATSVAHAGLLAALLSLQGVPARAISSARRNPWGRRHAIEAFRGGDVRVLVNYGVLTTGFDAPETRALVVARPVYSPGLYQQMIGRGLPGPLNGGAEPCLIINVEDNLDECGEGLAFRHFEHLRARG